MKRIVLRSVAALLAVAVLLLLVLQFGGEYRFVDSFEAPGSGGKVFIAERRSGDFRGTVFFIRDTGNMTVIGSMTREHADGYLGPRFVAEYRARNPTARWEDVGPGSGVLHFSDGTLEFLRYSEWGIFITGFENEDRALLLVNQMPEVLAAAAEYLTENDLTP